MHFNYEFRQNNAPLCLSPCTAYRPCLIPHATSTCWHNSIQVVQGVCAIPRCQHRHPTPQHQKLAFPLLQDSHPHFFLFATRYAHDRLLLSCMLSSLLAYLIDVVLITSFLSLQKHGTCQQSCVSLHYCTL